MYSYCKSASKNLWRRSTSWSPCNDNNSSHLSCAWAKISQGGDNLEVIVVSTHRTNISCSRIRIISSRGWTTAWNQLGKVAICILSYLSLYMNCPDPGVGHGLAKLVHPRLDQSILLLVAKFRSTVGRGQHNLKMHPLCLYAIELCMSMYV